MHKTMHKVLFIFVVMYIEKYSESVLRQKKVVRNFIYFRS